MRNIHLLYAALRRKGLLAGLMVGLLCAAPRTHAQTTEDALRFSQRHPSAFSAHLAGMGVRGFSGIGVKGALHSNPAGLGYVQSSSLSLSLTALDAVNESSSGSPGFSSDALSGRNEFAGLGNLSYVHDVPVQQGSLVFSLGIAKVQSFNRNLAFSGENSRSTISTSFLPFGDEYSLTEDGGLDQLNDLSFAAFNGGMIEFFPSRLSNGDYPFLEAVIPGTVIRQEGFVHDTGELYEGAIGMAVEAKRGLMVGLSANLVIGAYNLYNTLEEIDEFDQNGIDDYNVLQDDGSLLQGFDHLTYTQRLESDMVGLNLKLGASWQATGFLRLGAVIESPTWTYIEESYGASFTTQFDGGGVLTYGNRADDVGNGFFDYEFLSPWRLGAGVHASLGRVRLIGDLEVVDWSQMEYYSDTEDELFRDLNRQIDDQYGVSINTSLGAEIDFGWATVRGGAAVRPDPLKEIPVTSRGAKLNRDRVYLNLGVGVNLSGRWHLDIAVQTETRDDTWYAYPEDEFGSRQDAILQIDEALKRDWVLVQLTYRL
ncbi:MAG: hypothetical protein OXI38_08425 [Bacteroidota bacterium]|nr:hypothetical protein [Bacteroidota bacterium]